MDKKLVKYLKSLGINYIIHEHPAVFTVEENDRLMNDTPDILHTKSLFLKNNKSGFYLVSMYAKKRLNMKMMEKHLGVKKLTFGTPEEMKEEINLTPGSASIFGAIYIKDKRVRLILDKQVWEADRVGFHPNINTSTLELTHGDLEKFYKSLECEKEVLEL